MSNADDLFKAGDVRGARDALIQQVRTEPGDGSVRMFLFQLFALTGEWNRAKSQLEMIAKLDPAAQMLSVAYSQCIEAEKLRSSVFAGEADMPFLAKIEWGELLAHAIKHRQTGHEGADEAFAAAFDAAPVSSGTLESGEKFDWIADADARFGPCIEGIIAGRYGLMPFCALESLKVHAPKDLRDTVWIPAEFGLREGARVAGFIPVRYAGSETAEDQDLVLGRATDWVERDGQEIGLGHRLLILSDGSEHPVAGIGQVTFSQA